MSPITLVMRRRATMRARRPSSIAAHLRVGPMADIPARRRRGGNPRHSERSGEEEHCSDHGHTIGSSK